MVSRKNHNESFENLDSTSALFSTLKRKCKTHRGHANTAQKKLNVCFHHSNTLFLFFLCKMDKFNQVNERSQNSIKKKNKIMCPPSNAPLQDAGPWNLIMAFCENMCSGGACHALTIVLCVFLKNTLNAHSQQHRATNLPQRWARATLEILVSIMRMAAVQRIIRRAANGVADPRLQSLQSYRPGVSQLDLSKYFGALPAQKLLALNPRRCDPWPFSASKWDSGTVLERMFPRLNSLLTPSLLFHHLFGPFLTKNDHISSIIRFQNQAFRSRGSSKMRISSS